MDHFEKAISDIDERTGNTNDENTFESDDDRNIIDYSPNSKSMMVVSLSRKRWVNKIKEYAERFPGEVIIKHVNPDGSIVACVPVEYLHIFRPRQLSPETKVKFRENLRMAIGQ